MLELGVFLLQLFKAAGLTAGHVAILLDPAMVGCLAGDEVTADFIRGTTRGLHGPGLASLATICSEVCFENFFIITSHRAQQGLSRKKRSNRMTYLLQPRPGGSARNHSSLRFWHADHSCGTFACAVQLDRRIRRNAVDSKPLLLLGSVRSPNCFYTEPRHRAATVLAS